MFTEKTIKKYQKYHKRKCGEDLSDQESEEALNSLVNFFQLLLDIDKRNTPENYTKPKNHLEN